MTTKNGTVAVIGHVPGSDKNKGIEAQFQGNQCIIRFELGKAPSSTGKMVLTGNTGGFRDIDGTTSLTPNGRPMRINLTLGYHV